MLRKKQRGWIHLTRLRGDDFPGAARTLEQMATRGLVRRSPVGWVLRGRGMMLREVLLAEAGMFEEDTWRMPVHADAVRGIVRTENDAYVPRHFADFLNDVETGND